jgi:hypothetical protein
MGIGIGMRGKDLRSFMQVARQYKVIILVRHTNADSLRYVGKEGFYPKPAAVKAKTADQSPPPQTQLVGGRKAVRAYVGAKAGKAEDCWVHTMETLAPTLMNVRVDLKRPDTWSTWGVERKGVLAPRWRWRVDIDPNSTYFGCLQLKADGIPWSYIHGDYDLKDVIVVGHEKDNERAEGKLDGVKNFTPRLKGVSFDEIQRALNSTMGCEMVQHGAEAQFAWHGDEPITVAYPDWTHLTLLSAETVQSWYEKLNREVLAKPGINYLRDSSRAFQFGPDGMFKPGHKPAASWG